MSCDESDGGGGGDGNGGGGDSSGIPDGPGLQEVWIVYLSSALTLLDL